MCKALIVDIELEDNSPTWTVTGLVLAETKKKATKPVLSRRFRRYLGISLFALLLLVLWTSDQTIYTKVF